MSRATKVWISILAVVAVGGVLGGTVWYVGHRATRLPTPREASLEELYAQAKEAGFPTTKDELVPLPKDRPEDNGAKDLLAALGRIGPHFKFESANYALLSAWRKGTLSAKDQATVLRASQPALNQVREALRKPYIFIERDYDRLVVLERPEISFIKSGTLLLLVAAESEAAAGDPAAALRDFDCVAKLARVFDDGPQFIYGLIGSSVRKDVDRGIAILAAKFIGNPKAMAELSRLVSSLPSSIDLKREMRGEFYIGLSLCRNLDQMGGVSALQELSGGSGSKPGRPYPSGSLLVRRGLPSDALSRSQLKQFLHWQLAIHAILQHSKLDYEAKKAKLEQLEKELEDSKDLGNIISVILLFGPSILRPSEEFRGHVAVEKCFMLVMNYRAQHGHFPKTLKGANAEIADPYSDGPLNYYSSPNTCTVWTPGMDIEVNDVNTGGKRKLDRKVQMSYPPGVVR